MIRPTGASPTLSLVLGRPDYRRLWTARTVSQWGDTFSTVALALLVFHLTGSGLGVAGVVLAEIVPVLLLAPFAGPVVDRAPRVRVMVAADLARTGLVAALPLVDGHLGAVYTIAFATSAAGAFFKPAAGALLPTLVEQDQLVVANSGIWTAAVLSQIVLAPLAGLLVTGLGFAPAFWLDAASFAGSALALRHLSAPTAVSTGRSRWREEIWGGVRLIAHDRLLRGLAAGQLLAALSAGATSALLVVLARDHLRTGSTGYGVLLAAIGVGAATGPFLLTRLSADPRRPVFVVGPYLLRAAVDAVLATFTAVGVAVAALVGYGVGTSTGAVTFNSLLQAEVPEQLRGRVFAGFDVTWQTGRLLSLGIGGALADVLGIRAVYYLGAALLTTAATVGWAALRAADGTCEYPGKVAGWCAGSPRVGPSTEGSPDG